MDLIEAEKENKSVPAFILSFPKVDYLHTVSVVANKVWLEKTIGEDLDSLILDEEGDD